LLVVSDPSAYSKGGTLDYLEPLSGLR
jgi:hypothetical protein